MVKRFESEPAVSKQDDEQRQFHDWLALRMADANITAEDKKVFAEWLERESPEHKKKIKTECGLKVTLHDVRELFSWLKNRISSSDISDKERKLFNEWLVLKVTDHHPADHKEFHKLKRELLD